ncbi:MAG: type IV toxin-antitoxin system AbiEi family antitoxin [Candidatus Aminicenantales bacterium]
MANENEILREAVAAFNERFSCLKGLELSYSNLELQAQGRRADATVRIVYGKNKFSYQAEIKPRFSHAGRQLMVMQKASANRPLLLVSDYVNPEMADRLVRDGIEFIDTGGNAFIDLGFLHIISKGNRPKNRAPLRSPRLFKPSGIKVVFELLSHPELTTGTIRDIAKKSGVSLGTAVGVIDELKSRLYLIEDKKGIRRLVRKKDLFEAWAVAYPEQLRPKITLGKYQGEPGWWHEKALQPAWAQWGGEVAASRLTDYLFPQIITIYLKSERQTEFLLENKLRSDPQGNVEVLERFWPTDDQRQDLETVHPLLIYADLIATGNERDIQTARIIYDQHIARYLRED